jgi:hypothetical protein
MVVDGQFGRLQRMLPLRDLLIPIDAISLGLKAMDDQRDCRMHDF